MEYVRKQDTIILRLDKGDEITKELKNVAMKEKITFASFNGIGATDDFCVGVFDLTKKEYEKFLFRDNHEINVLTGNITTKDGESYVHAHITCTGKDGKVVGGHLLHATVSLTAEIVIEIKQVVVERKFEEILGINRWAFPPV